VGKKFIFVDLIRARLWKIVACSKSLRYPEELHNIILVGRIEGREL